MLVAAIETKPFILPSPTLTLILTLALTLTPALVLTLTLALALALILTLTRCAFAHWCPGRSSASTWMQAALRSWVGIGFSRRRGGSLPATVIRVPSGTKMANGVYPPSRTCQPIVCPTPVSALCSQRLARRCTPAALPTGRPSTAGVPMWLQS